MSSLSSAIKFGQPEMQRIPEFLIAYTRYLHFDETNSKQTTKSKNSNFSVNISGFPF